MLHDEKEITGGIDVVFAHWVLSLPYEVKIELLDDCCKDNEFGYFIALSKILLAAPISEGGVSTENIEAVRKKYYPDLP